MLRQRIRGRGQPARHSLARRRDDEYENEFPPPAVILGKRTKNLLKSPHHKIPHPGLVARLWAGHVKDFYTMLFRESLQLIRGRLVSGSKMQLRFLVSPSKFHRPFGAAG